MIPSEGAVKTVRAKSRRAWSTAILSSCCWPSASTCCAFKTATCASALAIRAWAPAKPPRATSRASFAVSSCDWLTTRSDANCAARVALVWAEFSCACAVSRSALVCATIAWAAAICASIRVNASPAVSKRLCAKASPLRASPSSSRANRSPALT